MPDIIKDGKGTGYTAQVGTDNRLLVHAITESVERSATEDGVSFHLLFDATPTGAGDCFVYIKNESDDVMIIEGFTYSVASAEQILVKRNDSGTAAGGGITTPVNCNFGALTQATGTFRTGNDITGLSGGVTVDKLWCTSAETTGYNFEQDIIIPKYSTFSMYAVTGGINVRGTVIFNYYEEKY